MISKRRTFLFGAGAVFEWEAPSTMELTKIVLESGFRVSDDSMTITKFIHDKLEENGYAKINFETILSVIEEFIVYYAWFDSSGVPSLYKCLFDAKFEDQLLNFSIVDGRTGHGYQLEIPKGIKYNYARMAYQNETPNQFFFAHLIHELLTQINNRVIKYSYFSKEVKRIDLDSPSSKSFIDWMKLHAKQSPLRLYSLNYDRVFKVLLEEAGLNVFEGFNTKKASEDYRMAPPDVRNILSNIEGDIYYNLHGSCYWDVEGEDFHQLPNPEIVFGHFPNLNINNTPAPVQIEKGKTLLVNNIITGYQKAQKSMITPFKQMHFAFDRDCTLSDEIYIIGYSFGDEHINSSLRTAIKHNPDLKLIIVDPCFMKHRIDEEVSIKLFSARSIPLRIPKKIDTNVYSHFDDSFIVYTMSFEEFRKRQLDNIHFTPNGIGIY